MRHSSSSPMASSFWKISVILLSLTHVSLQNKEYEWAAFQTQLTKPHEAILDDIRTEARILVSGGPSNPRGRARIAFQYPQAAMFEHIAMDIQEEIKQGLRYLFQTTNTATLALTGTGSTAMQTVLDNLIEANDTVLVPVNGMWSERVEDIVGRLGGNAIVMTKPPGEAFYTSEIEAQIIKYRPKIVFHVNGETSTGVFQQVEGLGHVCHMYDCLTIIDISHTIGLQPFFMDRWKIDAVYANVQKGIAAPVGLSVLSFSPRAVKKMMARTTSPFSYVLDFKLWLDVNYWGIRDPAQTQALAHSYPILMFYTLREALAKFAKEGLVASWRRHYNYDRFFRASLKEQFPFLRYYVKVEADQLLGATFVQLPENATVSHIELGHYLLKTHKIDVGTGMGPTRGQVLRLALLGPNAKPSIAESVLSGLRETFARYNFSVVYPAMEKMNIFLVPTGDTAKDDRVDT